MATIISMTNPRGGVGKTTIASIIAAKLAKSGRSALVIEVAPHWNVASGLGVEPVPGHSLQPAGPLAEPSATTSQMNLDELTAFQGLADADAFSASRRSTASTLHSLIAREQQINERRPARS